MEYPKVAIIVLNWNGVEDTVKCLNSLREITYPNYEVIVVDNGSEGNDVKVLRQKFGDFIHIIENDRNYGFAEGNNIGIEYALDKGADYVLVLNNDTVVAPPFLDELVKVAEGDAEIGIVGPKMYYMDYPDTLCFAGGKVYWLLGWHKHIGIGAQDKGQYDTTSQTDFITGAGMLIKRVVVEKIGLLPTDYFLQWEDIDYCTHAWKEGFKCVYVPQSRIWHKYSASFHRSRMRNVQLRYGIRAQIICRHKYLTRLQFLCFVFCFALFLTPARIVYYLLHGDLDRVSNLFQGIWLGFKQVTGRRRAVI